MKNKKLKSDEKTIVFLLFSLHIFWNIDMLCMNRVGGYGGDVDYGYARMSLRVGVGG